MSLEFLQYLIAKTVNYKEQALNCKILKTSNYKEQLLNCKILKTVKGEHGTC